MNTIYTTKTTVLSADSKGELQNAYLPLLNLVNKNYELGDLTTEKLNFDRYRPVNMLITDEYDGTTNIVINDDKNSPKCINSRFSILENLTFNIPQRNGLKQTNVYEDISFHLDSLLFKLYNKIPSLQFKGIIPGGEFKTGKYVFYFKFADADGNHTNIVQESGIVQVHIGEPGTVNVRMGMLDECANKCICFELSDIDSGFDYVKIFYERESSGNDLAIIPQYYMIDQNFPVRNGKCDITLTGAEGTTTITREELQNMFADIQTAKTQTIVDNVLFLGNVSSCELQYSELLALSWKIIPSMEYTDALGQISTIDYAQAGSGVYYDSQNVYYHTGYWDDEFYRFGIVYIYNNNLLSPVFNLQGCDLNLSYLYSDFFKSKDEEHRVDPDDGFFNKHLRLNSKGVIRTKKNNTPFILKSGNMHPKVTKFKFDFSHIWKKRPDNGTVQYPKVPGITSAELYLRHLNVKGFFIVRQKRIPTIIALGYTIGVTGKDYGSIPVLRPDSKSSYTTKSFLDANRLLTTGSIVEIPSSNIHTKGLLIPDFEVNEAVFNLIFVSNDFVLQPIMSTSCTSFGDLVCLTDSSDNTLQLDSVVKLTSVPKQTLLKTNGSDFFSTVAGSAEEAFKTLDVLNIWNKTAPQDLTVSSSLLRGNWGSYVGMSATLSILYGNIVNIRPGSFNLPNYDILEFEKRFSDFSLYYAVTHRYNIDILSKLQTLTAARGDCFKGLFTHRMMSNFIDPELPTNTKIVNPACWCENYAVRCTAEILSDIQSNLLGDSAGFYIPTPPSKSGNVLQLVVGILTGNLGMLADALNQPNSNLGLDTYANEIALAFEVYTGINLSEIDFDTTDSDPTNVLTSGGYDMSSEEVKTNTLKYAAETGKIKKVAPKELELNASGFNLKALFTADDKWELHGLALINRADVNAVPFGQWITFPYCSSYNLSFRDIDFNNAVEESKMNKKRAFYPLEPMDVNNKILESGIINGAAKRSLSSCGFTVYTTVPYIKLEFFNRIYWSKPNVSESFINSYRIIFLNQYLEYNKEFGAITKLVPLGNSLIVIFQHGIGLLPVNRTPMNETEASNYLSSKSVLPKQLLTITSDYGSMWELSIFKSPKTQCIYGVDTVAKKIWKLNPSGTSLEHLSDFKVTKFLNDFISLSEYDHRIYNGHINVKTHFNAFKNDVMFTFYKDIPMTNHEYQLNEVTLEYEPVLIGSKGSRDLKGNWVWTPPAQTPEYREVDMTANLILENELDPIPLIDKWEKGVVWNLCYNEVTKTFVTFYDWIPVESCNIDNIYFSFDRDDMDNIYSNTWKRPDVFETEPAFTINKVFIDKMFTENTKVHTVTSAITSVPNLYHLLEGKTYISLYYQGKGNNPLSSPMVDINLGLDQDWFFTCKEVTGIENVPVSFKTNTHVADCHITKTDKLTINDEVLLYQELRNIEGVCMYLWKHGLSGLYDNLGEIKPTNWYDKLREFNFEFVVNDSPYVLKIFNNLKIISNKTEPNKFEYEIVGEGYEWFEYKSIVEWINKKTEEDASIDWWKCVLNRTSKDIVDGDTNWAPCPDFPPLFDETRVIRKLPYLKMRHTDKKGTPERPHYKWDGGTDYWGGKPYDKNNQEYTYNCSEPCLVEDDQLNEVRLRTESLGNDMKKYGRIRGNMQYLEDLWNVEIRPVQITWCYLDDKGDFQAKKLTETRHRDKYIKIKIRYSGEDLALVQAIITTFNESYA